MHLLAMNEVDLKGKRVLIREDLNVPIKEGMITSDQRLVSALPTLKQALEAGARVMVMSHLGRPTEGQADPKYSMEPIVAYLQAHLRGYTVRFVRDYLDGVDVEAGELVVLENVRFNQGEKENSVALSKKLAKLCDVFVMDAFGTAHREQASTCGVAKYAPIAVAGPLLLKELEALKMAMKHPQSPIVVIVGGAKISTKVTLIERLIHLADYLIPGGGIANTFLSAQGSNVGNSLVEPNMIATAKKILEKAEKASCQILLPTDVVVGKSLGENCPAFNKSLAHVAPDDMILDIGPESVGRYIQAIHQAKTIIWNGPIGVFELPQFSYGTRSIALAIAASDAFSIAGGGETLAAIDQYDLTQEISYISTGGAAFLACLEGKTLPAVAVLEERAS